MSENFNEQLSAHFDGEESSLHSDTPFSAAQQKDLVDFEQIRERIAAPAPINMTVKDQQIVAALQAFDAAMPPVIDITSSNEKRKALDELPRKNHQRWFTLAAAFILCFAGVFAFYKTSSFFDDQRDTASEGATTDAAESTFLGLNQKATSENAEEESVMLDEAMTGDEAAVQKPNARQTQDFDGFATESADDMSSASETEQQLEDRPNDDAIEKAPATTATARMPQTTLQPPSASTPNYVPKEHADSSDLERSTAISSSVCGETLQNQGFVLQSFSETTIDGIDGELFFLSNKTTDSEIFVDRNCVQQ